MYIYIRNSRYLAFLTKTNNNKENMMIYAVTPSAISTSPNAQNVRNCNTKKQNLPQKSVNNLSFGSVIISYPKRVENKVFIRDFMDFVSDLTSPGYKLRINKNNRSNLQYGEIALSKAKVKDGQVTRKLMAKSVYDEVCLFGGSSYSPIGRLLGLDVKFKDDGALPLPKIK